MKVNFAELTGTTNWIPELNLFIIKSGREFEFLMAKGTNSPIFDPR